MPDREETDFWFGDPREDDRPSMPVARTRESCPACGERFDPLRRTFSCPACGFQFSEGRPT